MLKCLVLIQVLLLGCQASAAKPAEGAASGGLKMVVDTSKDLRSISPYIYGTHPSGPVPAWGERVRGSLLRLGGNRFSAYNWLTNASNAGDDYHNQNDGLLGGVGPGEAVIQGVRSAHAAGAAALVPVPMLGWVAADKRGDGDVAKSPDYLHTRFIPSMPRRGGPYADSPDVRAKTVYQDEYVAFVERSRKSTLPVFYSLDNEPDLWESTHSRLQRDKLTYAALNEKSIAYARAIKEVAPRALVFGPALSGYYGFTTLSGAPDRGNRDFIEAYLAAMRKAETEGGSRLLDVLDVHWYPEARGGGVRVTRQDASPEVAEARVQAPRSLWDKTYVEQSWIAQKALGGEPVMLLPRLKEKIEKFYPGTRLAITEYNYGAGNDISGGLAEADVLGIFAREGVFAACVWPYSENEPYIDAARALYRNVDGKGMRFGDTLVSASTSDPAWSSIYAAVDRGNPGRVTLVVLNKSVTTRPLELTLRSSRAFKTAQVYRLTGAKPVPAADAPRALSEGTLVDQLPARSATFYSLTR